MKNRLAFLLLTSCFLIFSISACDNSGTTEENSSNDRVVIVATVGMIADVTENIVRDRADVYTIIGPGIDPHLFKATRSDVARMTSADLVLYNGLLLEGKMTDALIRIAGSGKKVVAVSEQIDSERLLEPPEFQGLYDPHLWMDPMLWREIVPVIVKALIESDSEHAAFYQENAEKYLKELDNLINYSREILASIPKEARVLVTAHDAFNYFGQAYDMEVVGIQGLSTDSEAGVRDIENIVSLLVKRKVQAVFVESTVSDKNIKALLQGASAQNHKVVIGGTLFSDAMGTEGTYEGTYIGMIDHNVTTIARALGGKAPEGGMQNKLKQNSR